MGKTEIRTKRWGNEGRSRLGSKLPSQSGVPAGKSEPIPDCCREQRLETLQNMRQQPLTHRAAAPLGKRAWRASAPWFPKKLSKFTETGFLEMRVTKDKSEQKCSEKRKNLMAEPFLVPLLEEGGQSL